MQNESRKASGGHSLYGIQRGERTAAPQGLQPRDDGRDAQGWKKTDRHKERSNPKRAPGVIKNGDRQCSRAEPGALTVQATVIRRNISHRRSLGPTGFIRCESPRHLSFRRSCRRIRERRGRGRRGGTSTSDAVRSPDRNVGTGGACLGVLFTPRACSATASRWSLLEGLVQCLGRARVVESLHSRTDLFLRVSGQREVSGHDQRANRARLRTHLDGLMPGRKCARASAVHDARPWLWARLSRAALDHRIDARNQCMDPLDASVQIPDRGLDLARARSLAGTSGCRLIRGHRSDHDQVRLAPSITFTSSVTARGKP